jgi:hypothetical protein
MKLQTRVPIRRYLHAHEAVVANEYWYGDGPPRLKAAFSAAKAAPAPCSLAP